MSGCIYVNVLLSIATSSSDLVTRSRIPPCRWNKVNYTALHDNLIADLLREQHGGSFLQPSVMHGASGRRGSITGFGGAPGSGLLMGLGWESQQLQAHYGSNAGTATGMAMLGATAYGLSAVLPAMRPHSDSQPQPPAQNPSETEEAVGECVGYEMISVMCGVGINIRFYGR